MHDTGGGQRSAQLALEFLARDHAVLFVSHGVVTETVNLKLSLSHPRLVELSIAEIAADVGAEAIRRFLAHPSALSLAQVPIREWLPVLSWARRLGAVAVYDLIDEWDSELGHGWYRRRSERRVVASSDVLTATAPLLQRYLSDQTGRAVALLPNAFNDRLFDSRVAHQRPADLPAGPVAIYVGSLWGRWMDWALVKAMARAVQDIAFVFIGDYRGEGGSLPANCHFLGLKAQKDLPAYLAHAAAGLLPWTSDRVTQATSPLKVYEYVAMGLPVVAPKLEPLNGLPGVQGCPDQATFIAAVRDATSRGVSPEIRRQMADFANSQSWRCRVDVLLERAAASRNNPVRPSWLTRVAAWAGL
jgi:glycosyltransferase involved in cell wall biosynthesis